MRLVLILLIALQLSFAGTAALGGAIDAGGSSHFFLSQSFDNAAGKEAVLNITGPSDVVVRDRSGLVLPSRAVDSGNFTLVYATVPVDYLEYEMTSDSFTGKSGGEWQFDFVLGSSENVSAFNASIRLPEGAVVKSTNGAVSQDGGALGISWSGTSLDPSRRIHLRAGYSVEAVAAQPDAVLPLAAIAALLIIAFFVIRLRRGKETVSSRPLVEPLRAAPASLEDNSVFRTLDETDKEILREISAQGGKTTQAHIYTHTHVPKATLSRRLASLESRGIIRKSQKGNRNLISLTDLVVK